MVARTILTKREDAEIERIRKCAEVLAGDRSETAEAAERVKTVRGPDEVHTRVFRMGAIADLMETIVEAQQKSEAKAEAKADDPKASPKPQTRKPQARKPKK